jgi:hypothetical protein
MSFPGLELGMFPQMARHPGSESSTKAPNDSTEEMAVVPATLVELGEQALVEVADSIARGAPVVQCQLLASGFYEALKNELRDKTEAADVTVSRSQASAPARSWESSAPPLPCCGPAGIRSPRNRRGRGRSCA